MWRYFAKIMGVIVLLILVGWIAHLIATASGEAQLDWNGWRLTVPTGFLLLAGVVLVIVAVMFDRLVQFTASIPYRMRQTITARRIRLGRRSLALGMAAATAGDGGETMLHARKSVQYLGHDVMTDLLMAQASALQGDNQSARRYFQALKSNQDTAYFGHVGLMRLAVTDGDEKTALAEGRQAFRLKSDSPSIARAIFVLEAKSGHWHAASQALTVARRHTNTDKALAFDLARADAVVAFEASKSPNEKGADTTNKSRIALLQRAVRADDGFIPAALDLADCYIGAGENGQTGQKRKAIALLEKTFTRHPHPRIAQRLMEIWEMTPASNLAQLIRLTDKGGGKPEALFIVAHIAYQQSLWAEAERLAMRIAKDKRDSRVWRLLADLARHQPSDSKKPWPDREASLEQAALAQRPPAWVCGNCASHYVDWKAVCDNCQAFAQIRWQ